MRREGRKMSAVPACSQAASNLPETTGGAGRREPRAGWWWRMLRSAAASAGLLAAGVGAEAAPAVVENGSYRSATAAPQTWQAFAKQLQGQVEQRLAGDDERARHFQDYLTKRSQQADAPPLTVVLRTWVLADGKVNRVEFDGIDDPAAIDDLRALLIDGNVGAPPPEMLQPLHLRLSLRAKDPTREGQ
jgi:hypothetical protein